MTLNNKFLEKILYNNYLNDNQKILSIIIGEGHGINSTNYKIKLKTGECFYFKIIDRFTEETKKKTKIINECYQDNIKVPKIITNNQDEIITIQEDKLFILMKYYEGEKFSHKTKEIFSAGENLSILNKKLSEIKTILERNKTYEDLTKKELSKISSKIEDKKNFDKKVGKLVEELPKYYLEINNKIKPYLHKKQLVHFDYHVENVLFKNNNVLVILDFDSILTSFELQSVAFACDRFSKDIKGFITFLKGYQSNNKNFSSDEIDVIPFFAKKEAICRINYILRKHFIFNDKTWSFDLDKHLNILKRMKYVENELKNRCISLWEKTYEGNKKTSLHHSCKRNIKKS